MGELDGALANLASWLNQNNIPYMNALSDRTMLDWYRALRQRWRRKP